MHILAANVQDHRRDILQGCFNKIATLIATGLSMQTLPSHWDNPTPHAITENPVATAWIATDATLNPQSVLTSLTEYLKANPPHNGIRGLCFKLIFDCMSENLSVEDRSLLCQVLYQLDTDELHMTQELINRTDDAGASFRAITILLLVHPNADELRHRLQPIMPILLQHEDVSHLLSNILLGNSLHTVKMSLWHMNLSSLQHPLIDPNDIHPNHHALQSLTHFLWQNLIENESNSDDTRQLLCFLIDPDVIPIVQSIIKKISSAILPFKMMSIDHTGLAFRQTNQAVWYQSLYPLISIYLMAIPARDQHQIGSALYDAIPYDPDFFKTYTLSSPTECIGMAHMLVAAISDHDEGSDKKRMVIEWVKQALRDYPSHMQPAIESVAMGLPNDKQRKLVDAIK